MTKIIRAVPCFEPLIDTTGMSNIDEYRVDSKTSTTSSTRLIFPAYVKYVKCFQIFSPAPFFPSYERIVHIYIQNLFFGGFHNLILRPLYCNRFRGIGSLGSSSVPSTTDWPLSQIHLRFIYYRNVSHDNSVRISPLRHGNILVHNCSAPFVRYGSI